MKPKSLVLMPPTTISQIEGWSELKPEEQSAVASESQALFQEIANEGFSKLNQGRHLAAIRDILEPKKLWLKFLKTLPNITERSAYRYITAWTHAEKTLPEPALKVLLSRGANMVSTSKDKPLGAYTLPLKRLPPPKDGSPEELQEWATKLEKAKNASMNRQHSEPVVTEESLLEEAFRFARICFRKLPNNHKVRARWVHNLDGMMLAQLGVSNSQSIKPIAAPEEFLTGPGRPRHTEVGAA